MAKRAYKELDKFCVEETHNGYFSQDSKGKAKDTSGETIADNDTYSLIMKDKEKLLGLDNSLRFIFPHSALREGWDNPNVFQICTLNETKSDIKKRQEIGRGLRLAVDQTRKRIKDKEINRLTVIANEAYDDFAKTLQKEIEEEYGIAFKGRLKNKQTRTAIKYRKGFEAAPAFLEIWEKLKKKTTYRVNYKTDKLITSVANAIKNLPEIKSPSIRSSKIKITMKDEGKSQFVKDCETSEQIKFYFKLANWFKIPTPIGNHNPDWALVFEDDTKIYFAAEKKRHQNTTS